MASFLDIFQIFLYGFSWWVIPIITAFVLKKKFSKYPIECIIYEKRGENLVYNRDVAGRFDEPVNCYKLKISRDTIPIPKYDWILQNVSKPTNIFEKIINLLSAKQGTISLFKYGSKQYKPMEVKVGDQIRRKLVEVKNKRGEPIYVYNYEAINVPKSMSKLDFEVIDWDDINHLTQELRAIATRRSPIKNFMEKYGVLVGLGVVCMVIIVTVYMSYQLLLDAGDRYLGAIQQSNSEQQSAAADPLGIIPGK